jgi:hypothetical protein
MLDSNELYTLKFSRKVMNEYVMVKAWIEDTKNNVVLEQELRVDGRYLDFTPVQNMNLDYIALEHALKFAYEKGVIRVAVKCPVQLMVNEMQGGFRVPSNCLYEVVCRDCKSMKRHFEYITFGVLETKKARESFLK